MTDVAEVKDVETTDSEQTRRSSHCSSRHMPANHDKRTMDEMADEAYGILKQYGPMRCGVLGSCLFPNATGAVNCSCPYARIAGKVTAKLKREGRAYETNRGWVAKS